LIANLVGFPPSDCPIFPFYGVGEGDADSEGEASVSAAFFLAAAFFFLAGDGDGDALAVAAVVEVAVVCCFCAQEAISPVPTKAVIKSKTDFFIGIVKVEGCRMFIGAANGKQ
jgi:hypothetical protein